MNDAEEDINPAFTLKLILRLGFELWCGEVGGDIKILRWRSTPISKPKFPLGDEDSIPIRSRV